MAAKAIDVMMLAGWACLLVLVVFLARRPLFRRRPFSPEEAAFIERARIRRREAIRSERLKTPYKGSMK